MCIRDRLLYLNHFPFLSWEDQEKGSIHLFGHCHGNLNNSDKIQKNSIDIGLDSYFDKYGKYDIYDLNKILEEI